MKHNMYRTLKLFLVAGILLTSAALKAQDPTIRMVKDPINDARVIVYLEWPANPAATNTGMTNTSRISTLYSGTLAPPTVTSVQGVWSVSNDFSEALIDANFGAAANPDDLAYIDFTIGGPVSFGDVTTAGTADTLFKLTFASPLSTDIARMLQSASGVGAAGLDNSFTSVGFIPNVTIRPNTSTIYTAYNTTQSSGVVPLPVDLIEQDAVWAGADALVTWSTATEINNERFEIYRSMDGEYFELAGTVASAARGGNSSSKLSYSFVDDQIASTVADRVYYQIRQYDFDGATESFDVLTLKKEWNELSHINFVMYPNPNNGKSLKVGVTSSSREELSIFIYNSLGVLVHENVALDYKNGLHNIDTKELSKGVYHVALEQGGNRQIKQLLVN